jgi:hypothetical protein
MACTFDETSFKGIMEAIKYDCNTAFGGIKQIDVWKWVDEGETKPTSKLFEIEFNDNDGYSNYSEEKTASLDGVVACTQTLSVEVPKAANAKKVQAFANPNFKFVLKILTKAGKTIVAGSDFGMSLKTSSISSGAQRTDKDVIQIQFVADEINLCKEEK